MSASPSRTPLVRALNHEQAAALARLIEAGTAITSPIDLASVPGLTSAQVEELLACGGDIVKEEQLHHLNLDWFVIDEGGKIFVGRFIDDAALERRTLVRYSFPDFAKKHGSTRVGRDRKPLGDAWSAWTGRRQYDRVVFKPDGRADASELNLWQGFAIEPKQGSPESYALIEEHILRVVCGGHEVHNDYFIKLLARMVQRPDEAGEVITVLRGKEGTGKSTVGRLMRRIFGQHGMMVSSGKHLTGDFNEHLRDVVFLEASEAIFAGDKQAASALKALATENVMVIEAKGVNATVVRNRLHILMTSNESWVIDAGPESRRYFVLDVADTKRGNSRYFKALHAQIDNDEAVAAFLYELLHIDLSDFDHRAIPVTDALADQREQSATGIVKWAFDLASRGGIVRTALGRQAYRSFFTTRELFEDFEEWVSGEKYERRLSVNTFARELRARVPGLQFLREARTRSTDVPPHARGPRGVEMPETVEELHQLIRKAAGAVTDDEREAELEAVEAELGAAA